MIRLLQLVNDLQILRAILRIVPGSEDARAYGLALFPDFDAEPPYTGLGAITAVIVENRPRFILGVGAVDFWFQSRTRVEQLTNLPKRGVVALVPSKL